MTVDREQIRRDAQYRVDHPHEYHTGDAKTILALLAELEQAEAQLALREEPPVLLAKLEQAERERDEWEARWTRVVKDQLAEMARTARAQAAAPEYDEEAISGLLWQLADATLAVEQEQKP